MKNLLTYLLLLTGSSTQLNAQHLLISGKTSGLQAGTVLILEVADYNEVLDSTKIKNNTFKFKAKLNSSPTRAIIHTKDYSNYRFLWLENTHMTFDATHSDSRNAMVMGSETEKLSQSLHQSTDSLPENERLKFEQEFVENHPNSIVSANTLSVYATTWGKTQTKLLFDQFSEENKSSSYGREIAEYIRLNQEISQGDRYADFEMADTLGNYKKLSDTKGKAILLEFWASWCGPCRKGNPNLIETYKKYNPKGFEIFAVSLDENRENWLKAIAKDNLIWEHVSDLQGSANKASLIYGVSGVPDNFLIDEDGVIVGRNLREEELDKKIEEIVN